MYSRWHNDGNQTQNHRHFHTRRRTAERSTANFAEKEGGQINYWGLFFIFSCIVICGIAFIAITLDERRAESKRLAMLAMRIENLEKLTTVLTADYAATRKDDTNAQI
jgi:hypothetical protein